MLRLVQTEKKTEQENEFHQTCETCGSRYSLRQVWCPECFTESPMRELIMSKLLNVTAA